jgi:hypothetical protein
MERAEKKGFPGSGFFWQGARRVLRERKRLPEEELQVAGSKDGG